jgi:hypothetical protein
LRSVPVMSEARSELSKMQKLAIPSGCDTCRLTKLPLMRPSNMNNPHSNDAVGVHIGARQRKQLGITSSRFSINRYILGLLLVDPQGIRTLNHRFAVAPSHGPHLATEFNRLALGHGCLNAGSPRVRAKRETVGPQTNDVCAERRHPNLGSSRRRETDRSY